MPEISNNHSVSALTPDAFLNDFSDSASRLAGPEHKDLQDRVNRIAQEMNIANPVKLYINNQDRYEAARPRNNENAITIDPDAHSEDTMEFLILHELSHIKLGHHARLDKAEAEIKAKNGSTGNMIATAVKVASIAAVILGIILIFSYPPAGFALVMLAATVCTITAILTDKEIFPRSEKEMDALESKCEEENDRYAFRLLKTDAQREAALKYFSSLKDNPDDRRHPLNSQRVKYLQDELEFIRKQRQNAESAASISNSDKTSMQVAQG